MVRRVDWSDMEDWMDELVEATPCECGTAPERELAEEEWDGSDDEGTHAPKGRRQLSAVSLLSRGCRRIHPSAGPTDEH